MDDEIEEVMVERGEKQSENTDNVGETSVEINVESLIAQIKAEQEESKPVNEKQDARRQLEDFLDQKRTDADLNDFDDYELD